MIRFDPFTDRALREIRNRLSESLMHALNDLKTDSFESVASELLVRNPVQACRSYVEDRILRYRESFREIAPQGLTDKFFQALVL
jgi:hypothetical protein